MIPEEHLVLLTEAPLNPKVGWVTGGTEESWLDAKSPERESSQVDSQNILPASLS